MAERIPEPIISEIIAANDLVSVAAQYTELKRSGSSYVGLCPFHKEKTPSFHVSSGEQLYYCFGCGAGGNVIGFIERIENLDYVEAVKLLAERAGIRIPETGFSKDDKERFELRKKIYAINRESALYFRNQLLSGKYTAANEYVKKRGLNERVITAYGIGYAPPGWSNLSDYLEKRGFKKDEIVLSGVSGKSDKGRVYDRFRDRLIFPIIDVRGNVIGFGGRIFEGDGAKYLNSPETLVFNKRQNLFSLNLAKKSSPDELILVEGYMDVVSLYKYGITNAVASLGTALTQEQARLISRFVKKVVLCYDTDEAGVKATNRAIDVFDGVPVSVRILNLPEGKDPDEFVRKNGAEKFREYAAEAKSVTEYKLFLLEKKYNLNDVNGKIEYAAEAAKILSAVRNDVERDLFTRMVAEKTGSSAAAFEAQVSKGIKRSARREQREIINENIKIGMRQKKGTSKLLDAQRRLISLINSDRSLYEKLEITEDLFDNPVHIKLLDMIKNGDKSETAMLVAGFAGDDAAEAAAALSASSGYENTISAAKELISAVKTEKYNQKIQNAMQAGDIETLNRLVMEKNNNRGGN